MIQPHGMLLVLEEAGLTIRQVSDNSYDHVRMFPGELVDHPLDELLGSDQGAYLRMILRKDDLIRANPLKLKLPNRPTARAFNVLVHKVDTELVVEAEPIHEDETDDFQTFYHEVRQATARLQATDSEELLCQVAADEIRRIIGYDRVMVYRFDAEWNGQVIAESQDDQLASSYLGLHFPASDIPAQARRLYTVNRLRCIPDAAYRPVRLFRGLNAVIDPPLDMSQCVLRSVSPMHLEYLKNMGVGATLSVSLLKNGVLWGLIACHHYDRKLVCPERRLTCSFLGQIIESQLNMREDGAERAYRVQTSAIQVRFLDLVARGSALAGLAKDPVSLLDFVDAQGAAIVQGMKCTMVGKTPEQSDIPGLIDLMTGSLEHGVYATDSLAEAYPIAARYKDVASGMLGVEMSRERGDYVLWFRPEQVRMVNWAGNPDKPVSLDNGSARLHPRKSFELWKKAVTLHSLRWKPCEIAAVIELNKTFREVIATEEEVRARTRRQDAVAALGQQSLISNDMAVLFREAVEMVSRTLEVELCRVLHHDPDSNSLVVRAQVTPTDITETLPATLTSDDPFAAFAIDSATPVIVENFRTEPRFDGQHLYDMLGVMSGVAVPIADAESNDGTLIVYSHRARRFDQEDLHFLQLVANVLITAARRKRIEERLEHQSRHDALTGLPNRILFMERLSRATQNLVAPHALLLIDLDRFKEVNDTLGHHFGDLLLREVSARFQAILRRIDTLARLGGDEFVVLLPRINETDAVVVARSLIEALKPSFLLEDRTCEVGASIGIAIAPRHGDDPHTLLRRADVAMYAAKRSGDGVSVYSADQDEYNPARLDLMSDLRMAIEANELSLYYQPKVNLRTGKLEAVEALARWCHPKHGMIPPLRFIPMAEHAGLMGQLERWALNQAIDQHQQWLEQGLDLGVAVNLSPRVLHHDTLREAVSERFSASDFPIRWLTLEITESSFMQDPKRGIDVLTRLRGELGVKVSIDDFGIGYSSLAYLRRLPVDELKIDRAFVKDMVTSAEDTAIVKTVIELAHNLSLRVVAEGVEDRETLELLASLNCDQAQGYFLSRPIPADELVIWAMAARQDESLKNGAVMV